MHSDPFGARTPLGAGLPIFYRLSALHRTGPVPALDLGELPVTVKILLENVLRHAGGGIVREQDVAALAAWKPGAWATTDIEIPFTPARVILQDFTGVPAVVDLAAMRDAMAELGGDPARVNPLVPADLVIDHSVQVDRYGTGDSFAFNVAREYERNGERYQLLRWAQTAFRDLRVVPPGTGIVHQVNLEYLATVVARRRDADGTGEVAFPDTLVGTDSHTTMINGLGVLGYGVGGIEAEAVLLGQPLYQPMPKVIGVRLSGELPEGATATDLVLVVTEMLRAYGVVGTFVEFCGDGLDGLALADRATISNMSPEFGATSTLFPIDDETLAYLRLTGRTPDHVALVERYAKEQGLWREPGVTPEFDALLTLDLASVEPSLAGPRRPQDRVALRDLKSGFRAAFPAGLQEKAATPIAASTSSLGAEAPYPTVRVEVPAGEAPAGEVPAGRGTRARRQSFGRDRDRLGRDRRHHELHKHLQSNRHGRGRSPGSQRCSPRPDGPSHGQDEPGAGLARGHRVPARSRFDGPPREARVRPGRLRLHDLHRQQRTARCADRGRDRGERSRGRGRALGQPQLRRPHPPAGASQLPRIAPAGRGLCPGRHRGHRPHHSAARRRFGRTAGLHGRALAFGRGGQGDRGLGGQRRAIPGRVRVGLRGWARVEGPGRADRRPLPLGCRFHLRGPAALLRGPARGARAGGGDHAGHAFWRSSGIR